MEVRLYIIVVKISFIMHQSNRSFNISPPPGHLTPFPAREGGKFDHLSLPGGGEFDHLS